MIKELGFFILTVTIMSGCCFTNRETRKVFLKKLNNKDIEAIVHKRFGSQIDKAEDDLRMRLQDTGITVSRIDDTIMCNIPVHIAFVSGKGVLNKDFLPILKSITTTINKFPGTSISIESHTDSIGTLEKNLLISQERADVIMNNLVKKVFRTRDSFRPKDSRIDIRLIQMTIK
ncbi:OmpA family protein [Candidatus Liberibacter africanus]|uniref:OmpA family protein n=1 Tax=Liberibacter africanus TaxID=34020 RepID=UPI001FD4F028|nr:OmpA family protein [Candidatus Liberibacter africanus]